MKKITANVALAVGVAGLVGLAGTAVYAATTATSELSQTPSPACSAPTFAIPAIA